MYMRLIFIFIIIIFFPFKDLKPKGFNVIRDAEIENFLLDISRVLIDESDLNDNKFQFYIAVSVIISRKLRKITSRQGGR